MEDERERFPWEDVEGMFDFWTGKPELYWARNAWSALEKAGLTLFSDQIERTKVLVRIMNLATICREFYHLAFDETQDSPPYTWWADSLEISPFRIGQIVGSSFERGDDEYVDDDADSLIKSALVFLVDENRHEICAALVKGFGSESDLFYALWTSPHGNPEVNEDEELETIEDVMWHDLTDRKLRAFDWIMNGMPSFL